MLAPECRRVETSWKLSSGSVKTTVMGFIWVMTTSPFASPGVT